MHDFICHTAPAALTTSNRSTTGVRFLRIWSPNGNGKKKTVGRFIFYTDLETLSLSMRSGCLTTPSRQDLHPTVSQNATIWSITPAIHDVFEDVWITTGMTGIVPKRTCCMPSLHRKPCHFHMSLPNCTREQVWPNFFHRSFLRFLIVYSKPRAECLKVILCP
jgi:hypothetical protein